MRTPISPDTGNMINAASPRDKDDVLRDKIRSMVRAARQGRGLTQAALGKQVGASRFTINRIEAGATDLTPVLAEQLEQVLGLTELRPLLAQRDRLVIPTNVGRDTVVARMLDDPNLYRLRVVLIDNLDLYPLLYVWSNGDSVLRSEDVEVVVPSLRREHELFGQGTDLRRTIDYQVKRILDLKKSDHYAADSLRLYESDEVTSAMVLAAKRDHTEAAIWPPVSVRDGWSYAEAAALPTGVTVDQHTVAQLDAHLDALITGREPLRSNEILCRGPEPGDGKTSSPDAMPTFTRYFTVGEDQEEEVDDDEGIAVALVLVVALCPRKRHGVGRRIVTFMRASSRQDHDWRRSLFSKTVEDIDVRRSRAVDIGAPVESQRSTQGALAAALDINDFLESKNKIVPDLAYQFAAARELAMFGLDIDPARFKPIPMPAELALIGKPPTNGRKRASIAPRLFSLELSALPTPELATLQSNTDVEEVGVLDILEDPELNSFLAAARDCGFLAEVLAQQTLVDR